MQMYECQVLITVQLEANDFVDASNNVERSLIPVMKECFDYGHTSIIRGRVLKRRSWRTFSKTNHERLFLLLPVTPLFWILRPTVEWMASFPMMGAGPL